jgi:hypothetical protein
MRADELAVDMIIKYRERPALVTRVWKTRAENIVTALEPVGCEIVWTATELPGEVQKTSIVWPEMDATQRGIYKQMVASGEKTLEEVFALVDAALEADIQARPIDLWV